MLSSFRKYLTGFLVAALGAVLIAQQPVTISSALPAGTNAIGKLAANSGVDIGDVDVTSIVPGTGATNLGKAEDAAHSSGDTLIPIGCVRQDTAAALAGTDADYIPCIVDSTGRLHANVSNTVTVTGTVNVGNGSTTDTDDGTIAGGQSTVALTAGIGYAYDGSNNVRLRAATAAPITGSVGLVTRPVLPNPTTVEYLWTSAQTDDKIVDISAGSIIVVTQIQCTVDEATTVGVGFRIGFGASTIPTAPTDGNAVSKIIARHAGMVPGSGLSRGDGSGIVGVGADADDLLITTEAATGGGASCVISYYTPAS